MGKLDNMGITEFTRELSDEELCHFMLWLKNVKGIDNIKSVPVSELSKLFDKFIKQSKRGK